MSINIIVIRGAGDIEGEPIIDPLIGTAAVAIQRGRNVLDSKSATKQSIDLTTIFDPTSAIGDLIKVDDMETPEVYKAKVTSIRHNIDQGEAVTDLRLDRYLGLD